MDPNTTMETIGEGAKALTKFQEIVLKLFGPSFTKRQADADAYANERKLQTIRDNPDMEIVFANGQMNARQRSPEALAHRAEQRQLAESIKQEENLENVFEIAGKELNSAKNISEEPIDDDWLNRFLNIAKNISSEDMQFIWGKILAGEIADPGRFSLRTLDIIRNLSKKDAKAFEDVMPFVIKHGEYLFIPADNALRDKYSLYYTNIIKLDECNLMNSSGTTSLTLSVSKDTRDFCIYGNKILLIEAKEETPVETSFGVYMLTSAATELYQALVHKENIVFFFDFADYLFKKSKSKIVIHIHEITSVEDKTISYNTDAIRTISDVV